MWFHPLKVQLKQDILALFYLFFCVKYTDPQEWSWKNYSTLLEIESFWVAIPLGPLIMACLATNDVGPMSNQRQPQVPMLLLLKWIHVLISSSK